MDDLDVAPGAFKGIGTFLDCQKVLVKVSVLLRPLGSIKE